MKYLVCIILFFTCSIISSRAQEKPLVQFSGVIFNADTNSVVPYVSIHNRTNERSYSANYKGYFSFVARQGDTIIFTAIGYRREAIVIPSNLPEPKYTVLVKMIAQNIRLPDVTILPWASLDEFNRDFLTMKFADDDLEIAKKNVSRDKLLAMSKTLPRDAGEIQSLNFQNNHIELGNRNMNMRGANPLLNPFAWGALLQQIMEGDRSRGN